MKNDKTFPNFQLRRRTLERKNRDTTKPEREGLSCVCAVVLEKAAGATLHEPTMGIPKRCK